MSLRKRAFRPLLVGTLWLAGLLAALVVGSASAYVLLTGVWVASRIVSRRRSAERPRIESG